MNEGEKFKSAIDELTESIIEALHFRQISDWMEVRMERLANWFHK